MIDPAFWSGRRVLLTGHTGFKGAWLALWLGELGAQVTGFSGPPPSEPSLFALARVRDGLRDLRGDVRDGPAVEAAVREARPEVVLHLAAQALVRRSYEEPVATWEVNAGGTAHLLAAVRRAAPEAAVVVVTSDKCYANDGAGRAFREGDPLGGHDPYSASKAAQELVAASFRDAYGMRIATARAGNVIGGGDWAADRIVPDLVRAVAAGTPLEVRNPDAVRPWQHVLEPLSGYLLLGERLTSAPDEAARAWNFGPDPGDAWTVRELLGALSGETELRAPATAGGAEASVLRLDASLARERLGWRPRWANADAIAATRDWYEAVAGGRDPRELCVEQLRRYARGHASR